LEFNLGFVRERHDRAPIRTNVGPGSKKWRTG
jgi:hypothetical protein